MYDSRLSPFLGFGFSLEGENSVGERAGCGSVWERGVKRGPSPKARAHKKSVSVRMMGLRACRCEYMRPKSKAHQIVDRSMVRYYQY